MKRMKLTTAGRVVIFVIVLAFLAGIGGFGYNYYKNNIADDKPISSGTQSGSTSQKPTTKPSAGKTDTSDPVINLSLDEWVGWKPIIDANQGLTTQPGSIFDQLGIKVNINIINDATASSNALITGELNAAGYTTNRTAFLSGKFQEAGLDVVMPVFTNYSAGGDGIIAKSGINTVNDLLGKKIGVPRFSEAQTLVAWFVNKSDLSDADKQSIIDNMILFDDASETGEAFFAGQLDVAATWQPYLSYATENSGAHIMFSTTASKSLIMDGIVFRSDFAQAHPDVVTAFIDGIFQANAMYTTEFDYIRSVMPMFAGVSDEEIKAQCGDAEMMGYAENKEVLDSTAPSVYFDMCDIWESLGETVNRKAAMTLFDNQYLLPLASKYSSTGGLLEHSLNVYDKLSGFVARYPELEISPETVAVTALFHDLTKVNYYTVSSRNVKDDVTGAWHKEPFYKTEDRLPLGHGEKSVIILQSFIKLTRDEIFAIRWHMGSFDCAVKGGDYGMGNAFETCPLAVMTHLADMEATYLVEGLAAK